MRVLVTGGAGFIGSAVVRQLIAETDWQVCNVDKLTYAADPGAVGDAADSPRYRFEPVDISDGPAVARVLEQFEPEAVLHLAAESHVDRSIDAPAAFVQTNIVGTYTLLEAARDYLARLAADRRDAFRFVHVSTDEVFGSLGPTGRFTESSPYAPRSPYSASKAAADHLVRAWHHTFGLPGLLTSASNNFGPYQFPDKLVPLMTISALQRRPLPVYGRGQHVRDWLHVDDHARALRLVLERGRVGQTYNIGADNQRTNIDLVQTLCGILDEEAPHPDGPYGELVRLVPDRPGHDLRYALDAAKIRAELGWEPRLGFEDALRETVRWYLEHRAWWEPIWRTRYGGQRLGLGADAKGGDA